ncbi:MAG: PASTA domain-containing protein, partial [Rubrobacteraceae bacterium]
PQSDLYSLGIVLYEMLTGKLPFAADTPIGMMMQHISEAVRPPKEVNSDVPDTLDAVALRLLAKEPSERHPGAAALVEELESLDLAPTTTGARPDGSRTGAETIADGSETIGASVVGNRTITDTKTGGTETGGGAGGEPTGGSGGGPDDGAGRSGGSGRGGQREKRPMPWVVAGAGLAVVAALLVVPLFLLGGQGDPSAATVPNVVDDLQSAAEEELLAAGFRVEVESAESPEEAEGKVVSQDPVGGEEAQANSTATITIGEGVAGEDDDQGNSGSDFETVSDGILSVEVPEEWSDQLTGAPSEEGTSWTAHGLGIIEASVTASPSIEAWTDVFGGGSGVYAVASRELAQEYTDEELVSVGMNDLSEDCEPVDEKDYERSGYTGHVKEWTNCGGISDAGVFT